MSKMLRIVVTRGTINRIFPHLAEKREIPQMTDLAMFKSGAKLYKDPMNGVWRISGYSPRGEDTAKAVAELLSA